jgi:hypothetical protein
MNTKWEDRAHQRGVKFIGSELRGEVEEILPKVDIITSGGEKTGADADNRAKI